jgi:hypothetical protein
MEKSLDVLAAMEHVMNQHHVVVLNGIEDDVIARCEAPQFGGQIQTLPLSRAMYNQMSSSWASAGKERR